MAKKILSLLESPEEQQVLAEQNFSAALRMTMPQIIRQYVRAFDRQQRARALEAVSRFRRLPSWIPSRSAIFRASAPRWGAWVWRRTPQFTPKVRVQVCRSLYKPDPMFNRKPQ